MCPECGAGDDLYYNNYCHSYNRNYGSEFFPKYGFCGWRRKEEGGIKNSKRSTRNRYDRSNGCVKCHNPELGTRKDHGRIVVDYLCVSCRREQDREDYYKRKGKMLIKKKE